MSEEKTLQVLLFGATFNTQNMGVGALASRSIRFLTTQGHKVSIALLDYGTEEGPSRPSTNRARASSSRRGDEVLKKTLPAKQYRGASGACPAGSTLANGEDASNDPFRRNQCLFQIRSADLIAAISGGDSFSDIYGIERFFYVSLPMILAITFGRNWFCFRKPWAHFPANYPARLHIGSSGAPSEFIRSYEGIKDLKSLLGTDYDMGRHSLCSTWE